MHTIFIASSTASLNEAHAIKSTLKGVAEVTVWDEGIFKLSSYILEVLEGAVKGFDFGIFLMGADDLRQKNKGSITSTVPRDNVIFECGLFIGSLGRKRSFIVVPKNVQNLELPSDLQGLVIASYHINKRGTGDFTTTCEAISQAIAAFEKLEENEHHILGKDATIIGIEPGVRLEARENNSLIHHKGRLAPIYTGNFLRNAEKDICIIGLSLWSFINYFDSRPREEVKEPIVDALNRGVSISLLFLDPQSYYAKHIVHERKDKRLLEQIRQAINRALQLRSELEEVTNGQKINLRQYSSFPFGQMKRVDAGTDNGRILGYHYLTLDKRPSIPYFEIRKKANPVLFLQYDQAIAQILEGSKEI